MDENRLSIREFEQKDIVPFTKYWLDAKQDFLEKMGVDIEKLPTEEQWNEILFKDLSEPTKKRKSYYLIWELNNKPVGHSNINEIIFGQEAFMHLHLWEASTRKKGMGQAFVEMTLPYYFENFELKQLFSQPNAFNSAPNRTLQRIGFKFVKRYWTVPGGLNYNQEVILWEMTYEKFKSLKSINLK